jgi:hypothetical protein
MDWTYHVGLFQFVKNANIEAANIRNVEGIG